MIRLPEMLVSAWEVLLNKHGVRKLAGQQAPKSIAGGLTEQATKEHLVWRFTGSAARVELAILCPNHKKSEISDAFAKIFSGGKVLLVDVPCGSGAAALSILSVIANLRAHGVLPRMPMEVVLIGGEISDYARDNFRDALEEVRELLAKQAIVLTDTAYQWDVCDDISNTNLIREITLLGNDCGAKMLLLANFSDFLQGDGKWKNAQPQFDELFRHFRSDKSSAIWIEPQTNKAVVKGGFFSRLTGWLSTRTFVQLFSRDESKDPVLKDSCKVFNVFDESRHFRVNLAVLRVDLRI